LAIRDSGLDCDDSNTTIDKDAESMTAIQDGLDHVSVAHDCHESRPVRPIDPPIPPVALPMLVSQGDTGTACSKSIR
jgi:hypothetical protein